MEAITPRPLPPARPASLCLCRSVHQCSTRLPFPHNHSIRHALTTVKSQMEMHGRCGVAGTWQPGTDHSGFHYYSLALSVFTVTFHNPLHPLLRQIRRSRAFRRRRSGICVRLRPLPLRRVAGEVDEKDFTRLRGREACSPAFGQAHGRRRDLSLARVDRLAGTGAARSQLVREGGRRVHARHAAPEL